VTFAQTKAILEKGKCSCELFLTVYEVQMGKKSAMWVWMGLCLSLFSSCFWTGKDLKKLTFLNELELELVLKLAHFRFHFLQKRKLTENELIFSKIRFAKIFVFAKVFVNFRFLRSLPPKNCEEALYKLFFNYAGINLSVIFSFCEGNQHWH
jgi:hypothetical protein